MKSRDVQLNPMGDNRFPLSRSMSFSISSVETFKLSMVFIEEQNSEIIRALYFVRSFLMASSNDGYKAS